MTGSLNDTADFDPSISMAILTPSGPSDIYIAKYDATSNYLWAFNGGETGLDEGLDITIDAFGYINVTGHFQDTADFDPSIDTANLISNSQKDIFIGLIDKSWCLKTPVIINYKGIDGAFLFQELKMTNFLLPTPPGIVRGLVKRKF